MSGELTARRAQSDAAQRSGSRWGGGGGHTMPGSQAPKQGVPLITSLVPEALDISHHCPGTLLEIKGLCNGGPRQVAGSQLQTV